MAFLYSILDFFGKPVGTPIAAKPATYDNRLGQNYPNPFNPQTTIAFTLKEAGPVELSVYDVRGSVVRTLLDNVKRGAGAHEVRWNGTNNAGDRVASGVYFYRMKAGDFVETRRMVLLK